MMKRIVITIIAFCIVKMALAQDVIVKKDGSTILSKVLEVNTADIKYKKFSNQNGPTYTINMSDVMAINYENGEKDTFDFKEAASNAVVSDSEHSHTLGSMSDDSKRANDSYISAVNNVTPVWTETQKAKKANATFNVFKIDRNSVLENDDVKIHLTVSMINGSRANGVVLGNDNYYGTENYGLGVKIQNKTRTTLYIDLGQTFLLRGEEAQPYYIPTATSTTHGTSTEVGVNMGAVAGAMGIGGSVGRLAGGVNVGGGSSNSTTTTEYSQRMIAVPPMSSKSLENQILFTENGSGFRNIFVKDNSSKSTWAFTIKSLMKGLMVGDIVHWEPNNSPIDIQLHVSYSQEEQCNNIYSIRSRLYVSETYGIKTIGGAMLKGGYDVEHLYGWQNTPFHFSIENKPSEGMDISSYNVEHTGK